MVDWGTTVPATGHSYALVAGVLKCTGCDALFNGIWTDGKTYVDGVVIADGWNGDYYYVDGKKVTGIYAVDGVYYNFGDDGKNQGKYTGLVQIEGKWYYSKIGVLTGGWVQIGENWHYFDTTYLHALVGTWKLSNATFTFDETGKTKGAWKTTADGTRFYYGPSFYRATNPGYTKFVKIDGRTYNFDKNGYITPGTWALRDSTAMYKQVYTFNEGGVLVNAITETGVVSCVDGYYYINDAGIVPLNTDGTGIVMVGADCYYVLPSGKVAQNSKRYVTSKKANGLVKPGEYTFGADGKMEKPYTGIKNVDGVDYYYQDGAALTNTTGLIVKVDGDFYYVTPMGKIKKNFTTWITTVKANGLIKPGEYTFGADGKMVTNN